MRSLDGEFSKRVRDLFDGLVRLRAWLEAALDFPEEEIDFLSAPQLDRRADAVRRDPATICSTAAQRGAVLRDGLHVVIAGRPNAGKSSLLNALAQSERAIVTPIPGTTRDVLRETINLDGIALTLVDTAGLRERADEVEREGIRRARAELARADVVVLVTDSASAQARSPAAGNAPPARRRIIVHNKIDLAGERARTDRDANGRCTSTFGAHRRRAVIAARRTAPTRRRRRRRRRRVQRTRAPRDVRLRDRRPRICNAAARHLHTSHRRTGRRGIARARNRRSAKSPANSAATICSARSSPRSASASKAACNPAARHTMLNRHVHQRRIVMIELFYWPTPNGHKITLFLEEAGLAYTISRVDIWQGRAVPAGFSEDRAEQSHAGDHRPQAGRRRCADQHVRIRRDPDVSRREDRQVPAERHARQSATFPNGCSGRWRGSAR